MEGISTKQKILNEALTLFSEKGYEAVSVGQIAKAVGIKAPSLYKHYESKQSIFNAILEEMDKNYEKQVASMNISGVDANTDLAALINISDEVLVKMVMDLFLYFLHDEDIKKFRKMLTIEQYHNRKLASFYTKQYVDDTLSYQSMLLGLLSQFGTLKQENPQIMALHFYSPLYLLLTLCDRHPEREKEALSMLERHIRQFNKLYKKVE